MYITALLLLPFLLVSCMTAKGTGTEWTITAVGTDITGLDIKPTGMTATKIDNSAALKAVLAQVSKMWTNYLMAEGLKFLAGKYYDHAGLEVSSAQTVQLEELRNAKSLAEGNLALETLKHTATL